MEIKFSPHAPQAFHFERDLQAAIGYVTSFGLGDSLTLTADMTLPDPTADDTTTTVTAVGVISEITWGGRPGSYLDVSFVVSTSNRASLLGIIHQDLASASASINFVIYDYDPLEKSYYKAFHTNDTAITGQARTGTPEEDVTDAGDKTKIENLEDQLEGETDPAKKRELEGELKKAREEKRQNEEKARKKAAKKAAREAEARKVSGGEVGLDMKIKSTPEEDPLSPQVWEFTIKIDPPQVSGAAQVIHYATGDSKTLAKNWGIPQASSSPA